MLPNDLNSWARLIERVAQKRVKGLELDDALLGSKQKDTLCETVRLLCLTVPEMFPVAEIYCSPEGDRFLEEMAIALRRGADETRLWLLIQAEKYQLEWLKSAVSQGVNPEW